MNAPSSLNRQALLHSLKTESFDLLIIGGGITGVGIALDGASRGLKVALVEKGDFSSGTSSRSTKLIHGGLRYLKQFEIGLVHEVGRERAVVHKLAPHLVRPEKMLLPLKEGGTFGRFLTSIGLKIYDILAGVKDQDKRVILTKRQALKREPLLDPTTLKGAGLYAEYRTDDSRLTIEVMKTAVSKFKAVCINYLEVTEIVYNDKSKAAGAKVKDIINDEVFEINSKILINATGPWVDELRGLDKSLSDKRLHLTKGVHIVVDHQKFPISQAVYFDVADGRMIFAIPRGKCTYIGTTDTDYFGDKNDIHTELVDVQYLLNAVSDAFPSIDLEINNVRSAWAGLRPLIHEEGKSPSELSRKDEVFMSKSGLISIAGGKLTGYRIMAKKIIDVAIHENHDALESINLKKCFTSKIELVGGHFKDAAAVKHYAGDLAKKLKVSNVYNAQYLVSNYGRQSEMIIDSMRTSEDPFQSLLEAEIDFCIQHELAMTPTDFFVRRTGRLYFDIESVEKYKSFALKKFATYFNWNDTVFDTNKAHLEKVMEMATHYK